jgi:hypothetical protein
VLILGNTKIKNDIIFIGALLLIFALAGGALLLFREKGNSVEVKVDGEIYGVYSLSKNQRIEVRTGENGEECNVLVIENGRAYIESASCPDGICASHRPISYKGASIICLPNKVVVSITSESESGPDIIV